MKTSCLTIQIGDDCTDPGPYNGDMSPGNPFPVYVDAVHCANGKSRWIINYLLYFVHDGSTEIAGHKHDWEHVSVMWFESENATDWWYRGAVVYSQHGKELSYRWDAITTVDEEDVKNTTVGMMKNHPKAFVGMYKHAVCARWDPCRFKRV